MTKKEARSFLIDISYKLGNMAVEYLTEKDGEKMREAVKILEQEPCDAISRQAAIDEIIFGQSYITKISPTGVIEHLFDKENKVLEEAVERIEKLPSVNPQPKTDYEVKLKDDMVTVLEDLDLQIDDSAAYNLEVAKVQRLIRDKIDKLKEGKE